MSGYKTYFTGVGFIIFGIALYVQDQQEQGISRIMEGLGLIFLRQGIAKAEGK